MLELNKNKCYCSDFNPKCEYCKEKDNLSQQIVTEGVSHSNTMGTHANRPADINKGCGKDLYYEFYTEDDFKENKTGIIGKCGQLKHFPNKEWKERMYCKECKKAVEE